jgi:hypothetical protein
MNGNGTSQDESTDFRNQWVDDKHRANIIRDTALKFPNLHCSSQKKSKGTHLVAAAASIVVRHVIVVKDSLIHEDTVLVATRHDEGGLGTLSKVSIRVKAAILELHHKFIIAIVVVVVIHHDKTLREGKVLDYIEIKHGTKGNHSKPKTSQTNIHHIVRSIERANMAKAI